jgi:hypothetical protein
MGRACGWMLEIRNVYRILVGKSLGNAQEKNVKTDLRETRKRIELALDRVNDGLSH